MAEDLQIAIDVLGSLGRASVVMSENERRRDMPAACEVAKETLLRGAQALVAEAGGRPMLSTKSCDGTPITVTHRSSHSQPSGKRVRVSGRQCQEFLVCNQFVRTNLGGADVMKTRAILGEPTPLLHGKTVPAILLASRQHWHRLRDLGHFGCAIEHYCWDRLSIASLEKHTRQWHASQCLPSSLPCGMDAETVQLSEFVCITACALHDAHNALKWSMHSSFNNKDLVRDVYIGFEALRRSADLVSSYIYEWLGNRLRPHKDRGAPWAEARMTLWLDLGVDPVTAQLLAHQLQLVWDGSSLFFLEGAFWNGDLWEAVASGLLAVWRFPHFSDSRWLTVGTSCRTMTAAFLTGIEDLVQHIRKHSTKLFYLRGFARLDVPKKEFIVVCGVVSRVAEALQAHLMHDNRVAKQLESIWDVLAKQMKWVIDLPADTYSLLGEICQLPGTDVADLCINAAHVSLHFVHRRVLAPASELPWSLVRGDVLANLDELAQGECPEEPISKNMWRLLHRGFNRAQLVAAVEMLGEAGWTSLPAEQQHASLANLHRWHPDYDTTTIISRSLLLQTYKLLPTATKEEKEAARLSAKLQRILNSHPDKVHGRSMLISAMVAICQGKKDDGQAGYDASMFTISKSCVSRSMYMWAQQSLAQQNAWHGRARKHANTRKHLLQIHWEVLAKELAEVEKKIEKQSNETPAVTMRSASMDDSDLACFARLWQQPAFRDSANISMRRSSVGHAPAYFRGPTGEELEVWHREDPTMPAWAAPLVRDRRTFMGSALAVQHPDGSCEFWKLLFAVKSPKLYLGMCQLYPVTIPSMHDLAAVPPPVTETFAFNINYADCASAADVVIGPNDQLRILFRLRHRGGTLVTSDTQPMLLDMLVDAEGCDFGPAETKAKGENQKTNIDPEFDQLVHEMPWLQHLDFKQGFTSGEAEEGDGGFATSSKGKMADIDEDQIWEGLANMEKARSALAVETEAVCPRDFVPKIRGGTSEVLKSGEALHAVQGQCTNKDASDWARIRGQTTFKATFSEHGPVESKVLVRSWCHRMQHFYNLEMSAPADSDFAFTEVMVKDYQQPTELSTLAAQVSHPKYRKWLPRIEAIHKIPKF